MNAEHLLGRASAVIGHRRGMYGAPESVFERAATRWSQVLGTRVTPAQVIICLIDLKVRAAGPRPAPPRQHHGHRGLCRLSWRRCWHDA